MVWQAGHTQAPRAYADDSRLPRLGLDDRVDRWWPPIPQVNPASTIRQLLNHTSGVFDITDSPGYRDSMLADPASICPRFLTLRMLGAPLFAAGQGWSYSNSNYLLVGMIVEAAGPTPLHTLLRRELFVPLVSQQQVPAETSPSGCTP